MWVHFKQIQKGEDDPVISYYAMKMYGVAEVLD
jgi:hypothetical protein